MNLRSSGNAAMSNASHTLPLKFTAVMRMPCLALCSLRYNINIESPSFKRAKFGDDWINSEYLFVLELSLDIYFHFYQSSQCIFTSMSSLSLCVDLNAPETWLRSGDGIINRNAMIDSSISHIRDQMTVCLPSLNKAQLTDREVHALFALILCETDMRVDVSELLLSLLDSIRKEVLQDLQCYYREEMGLRDCSSRLGNLMTVCHAVRECTSHFYAFLRMQVTLFDLWSAETQLKELFL
ncbi:hypothetical protein PENTCL1PPCAC_15754 [Pristionchus entomophagus]|uniref:NR LBD domain-containing protein n=1 Tax=Pristionchus entomophagus TaxID=358040 RepID=A0AAV5TFQ7_9BILA|nr:hypothetical protein PENTCL1PPCAC_15754 [Pristionchus entomophagus]